MSERIRLDQRLRAAGRRRQKAEADRSLAARNLRNAVREASGEMTQTRIAEVAGISRQTVHEMLKEGKR